MRKVAIAFATLAALGFTTLAAPNTANAWCRGCVVGGVAAGILGGALIGSAIANPYYYAPPPAYYPPAPAYRPAPVYYAGPACRLVVRRVWVEGRGWRNRRVEVCR